MRKPPSARSSEPASRFTSGCFYRVLYIRAQAASGPNQPVDNPDYLVDDVMVHAIRHFEVLVGPLRPQREAQNDCGRINQAEFPYRLFDMPRSLSQVFPGIVADRLVF